MWRQRSERLWLPALLLLATLVVRGSVLVALGDHLRDDPDAYREIAANILQHGIYGLSHGNAVTPTAFRPPLYPFLLALASLGDSAIPPRNVALLHLALGLATVWLTYCTALRFLRVKEASPTAAGSCAAEGSGAATNSHAAALAATLAALLVACDPILLNQSALVMTETLAAFLTVLSLYFLARFDAARTPGNAGLVGAAIGLAILCRPTYLPWLALVALVPLALKASWPRRIANSLVLLAVAAAVVAPWTIRNFRVFGKPIATTTHGGYTLLLGNNDEFYDYLKNSQSALPWSSAQFDAELAAATTAFAHDPARAAVPLEVYVDRQWYAAAQATIRDNPGMFVYACLYREAQFWNPLPHQLALRESPARRILRHATAAWYVGLYLLVAAGIYRLRGQLLRPPWVYGLLLCFVYLGLHTFYWSNLRMRAPLIPFLALVACVPIVALARDRIGHLPRASQAG